MRKIASRRQHGDFKIPFELAEPAKFFYRCDGSLLAPHEQGGLTEASQRVTHIDVEVARKERAGRVAGTTLM